MTEQPPSAALWQELLEKDDRTSPEEYPDMCLIKFEEFQDFLDRFAKRVCEQRVKAERERLARVWFGQHGEGYIQAMLSEANGVTPCPRCTATWGIAHCKVSDCPAKRPAPQQPINDPTLHELYDVWKGERPAPPQQPDNWDMEADAKAI